ncbi:MurR/RpiR family transcriptional regulator [Bacillus sp. 1P06AnD]|uniref:MurR/RpiR family transcriptional regulator n=1 Tax=Bacillus sp. 1P06AnD TaxID=3132208 RepID=UPI0039A2E048
MDIHSITMEMYPKLSTSQKKVAKFLLDHSHKFAIASAQAIGNEIGVSETTIIRFCYALGFKRFSELQAHLREQFFSRASSLNVYHSAKLEAAESPNFLERVMGQDADSIQKTINQLSVDDFNKAINHLAEADQVFISGQRLSYAAAHWFSFTLRLVKEKVQLYRSDYDDFFHFLDAVNDRTVFVSLCFHRYVKETVKLTEMMKEAGAFVIGITDSKLAPIAEFSDALLTVKASKSSTIDTAPALFSLLNSMVAGVSVKDEAAFKKRKEQYDSFNKDDFFY